MAGKHRNTGDQMRVISFWKITLMAIACTMILASCGPAGSTRATGTDPADPNRTATPVVHGPAVDRIILELQAHPAQALAELAAGRADLILDPLPPAAFRNISAEDLEKLYLHPIPGESWSLLINPIPNAAPYTWTSSSGQTSFNPLAIRELRYALNWLFDRQHLVNEILGGRGEAGFTPLPPGLPATARYDAVPAGLGMSAAGDEDRAIGEITSAMDAAARLPENEGRLLKGTDGFWYFDGQAVSIKFLIRADEPAGRLPLGRYLAARIEKAGIRVQRLERDRSALALAYFTDPAELAFHVYAESWAPRTKESDWVRILGQQYAPGNGTMPGGADPSWWRYRSPELDSMVPKTTAGRNPGDEVRLAASLDLMELGLKESVRIYLAFQHQSFASSKARLEAPLMPDSMAAPDGRSLRTLRLRAASDGDADRSLRVLLVQPEGDPATGSWDAASPEGFGSGFSGVIAQLVSDPGQVQDSVPAPRATQNTGADSTGKTGSSGRPYRWHNGIEAGMDDGSYLATAGTSFGSIRNPGLILPWDLYEVLGLLAVEAKTGGQQPDHDLGFPRKVDAIKVKYRQLLEQQWVPPALEGKVSPELAARRYRASLDFIESRGHALISNGPFVLESLDRASGTAILEAFQAYPYGSEYPVPSSRN